MTGMHVTDKAAPLQLDLVTAGMYRVRSVSEDWDGLQFHGHKGCSLTAIRMLPLYV